jgi:tRNA/tmRNA/rRNA uracil-C5-methylase (TrmA/RlmC/RlmD family)
VPDRTEDFLERNAEGFDCMLADPPRAGLSRRTVGSILEKKPSRLVYVSCDPATLVRDILWLGPSYRVRQFILFDLFPQTFHFEVAAEMEGRSGLQPR